MFLIPQPVDTLTPPNTVPTTLLADGLSLIFVTSLQKTGFAANKEFSNSFIIENYIFQRALLERVLISRSSMM